MKIIPEHCGTRDKCSRSFKLL